MPKPMPRPQGEMPEPPQKIMPESPQDICSLSSGSSSVSMVEVAPKSEPAQNGESEAMQNEDFAKQTADKIKDQLLLGSRDLDVASHVASPPYSPCGTPRVAAGSKEAEAIVDAILASAPPAPRLAMPTSNECEAILAAIDGDECIEHLQKSIGKPLTEENASDIQCFLDEQAKSMGKAMPTDWGVKQPSPSSESAAGADTHVNKRDAAKLEQL